MNPCHGGQAVKKTACEPGLPIAEMPGWHSVENHSQTSGSRVARRERSAGQQYWKSGQRVCEMASDHGKVEDVLQPGEGRDDNGDAIGCQPGGRVLVDE